MHVRMHMNMHTSFGSIVFALGHCFMFSSAVVLARSLYFPAEEKLHSTETNTGAYTKQQISSQCQQSSESWQRSCT